MEKLIILYYQGSLETYNEYTLEELQKGIESEKSRYNIAYPLPILKTTVEVTKEWGYDSEYARFEVKFYREETDEEFAIRKEQVRIAKELAKKQAEQKEELLAKKDQIQSDPEYQKYLELQKKFKL